MPKVQRICFVVMGFGEKIAYSKDHKPRVLDLDATYSAIIEPAVKGAGLRCIRADQVLSSGMIDTRMYEMLLRADLVIADLSTGNVNAVYELGVRHALRPKSTIIMQEDEAAFHFDLSHISTFTYHHLGSDIGVREAEEKQAALQERIEAIMANPTRDSPVYEFLRDLEAPIMSSKGYEAMLTVVEEQGDVLERLISQGKARKATGDLAGAAQAFGEAAAVMSAATDSQGASVGLSEREFVVQQYALTTYKSREPSEREALEKGLQIIEELDPDHSNDIETLGIGGAVRKRLWLLDGEPDHLDKAIKYYGRGFSVLRDYYNGENYATCLIMRSEVHSDEDEAHYDRMTAKKVRLAIVRQLEADFDAPDYPDRSDQVWMHATMANCLHALFRDEDAEFHEKEFKKLANGVDWMLATYKAGKQEVLRQREVQF